jgi:hypothetical protein
VAKKFINQFLVISFVLFSQLHASVWQQKMNRYFLSGTQSFYSSETIFNSNGERFFLPLGGVFTKYETNLYYEYGLEDNIMFLANMFYYGLSYRDSIGLITNGGFGDQEVGLQFQLLKDIPTAALQFLVSFPFYTNPGDPPLGNGQVDLQVTALVGSPFGYTMTQGFWEIYFGLRKRFEAPSDQIRAGGTIGLNISRRVTILFATSLILGLGNQDKVDKNLTFSQIFLRNLDFTLLKIEPAIIYKFNKHISGYVGYSVDAFGRDVGAGRAFKLGLWFQS